MNPFILYDNRFDDTDVITATGEDPDHLVENLLDYRTYTFWKDSAFSGSRYVTVDCGASKSADTIAVSGHNLYDCGATISVESSNDNFVGDVTERLAGFTVSDNKAFSKVFTSASDRYWRIKLVNCTEEPRIAVLLVGVRMTFPYPPETTYVPFSEGIESISHISKVGSLLGSIIQYHPITITPSFKILDSSWVYGTFLTFWDTHGRLLRPFFWVWDIDAYPSHVFFVVIEKNYKFAPEHSRSGKVDRLTLSMIGVRE